MKDKNFKTLTPYELGLSGKKKAIPFLIEYLKNGSTNERRLAASAINKLSKFYREDMESAIPYLIKNLSFDSPQVRQYTLKALLALPLQKELQPIYENIATSDDKKYNRNIAKEILAKYHNNQTDKSIDDPLLKLEISANKILNNRTKVNKQKRIINPKEFLQHEISIGNIKSKDKLLSTIKRLGLIVNRHGQNYMGLRLPGKNTSFRIKYDFENIELESCLSQKKYEVDPSENCKLEKSNSNKDEFVSTTVLSQWVGLKNFELSSIFSDRGLIYKDEQKKWRLTDLGIKIGGEYKRTKSGGALYVVWPANILDSEELISILKIKKRCDPNTSKIITDNKLNSNNHKQESNTDNKKKYLESRNWKNWLDKDYDKNIDISKKSYELTDEQKKIIAYDLKNSDVLKIEAFAGTGKTTTILEYALARPHTKFLYIAFNKSVQIKAEKEFPINVICKTAHSLAWPHFGLHFKNRLIPKVYVKTLREKFSMNSFSDASTVLDICTNFLISADDKIGYKHIPKHKKINKSRIQYYLECTAKLWATMSDPKCETIGTLHDVYLKLYQLSRPILNFGCILLDEAQDTNPVTEDIILRQKCSKIIIGDKHQQIYSFRGACNALNRIQSNNIFYLTKSFRFGDEIAWIANSIIGDFKKEEKQIRGSQITYNDDILKYAYIARTNAFVFGKAVKCLKTHKIGFLGGIDGYRLNDILDLYYLYSNQRNLIKNQFILSFGDYDSLHAYASEAMDLELISRFKIVEVYTDDIPGYIETIRNISVSIEKADIVLSTAHKSKGSQFGTVEIGSDYRLPFEDGKTLSLQKMPDEDEINLIYVAVTRAKKWLKFEDISEWKAYITNSKLVGYNKILRFLSKSSSLLQNHN